MPYPAAPDSAHVLQDSLAITAAHNGTVGGVARVFDFGAATLWTGVWITKVTAIASGVGLSYARKIELSNDNTFATGVIEAQPFTLTASPGTDGEIAILLSNKISETVYRYAREVTTPAGVGASVTLSSWIVSALALASVSTPALAAVMGVVTERFNQATALYRAWSGGLADGGPNSDGKYPLSDAAGNTYLVECPAKLVEMITSGGGMTTGSINSLPVATEDDIDPSYAEPTIIGVVGPPGGRELKRFSTYLINARKTKDLSLIHI